MPSFPRREPRPGSFQLLDGRLVRVVDGHFVDHAENPELRALIGLRDAALRLLALEADAALPDEDLIPTRGTARRRYEQYVNTWGPLNRGALREEKADAQTGLPLSSWRRPDLGGFGSDPDYLTVIALETYDTETATAAPAAILTRRVNGHPRPVRRVANAHEALAVSLGEGSVDLARIAGLLGLPNEAAALAALSELVFADPELGGRWVAAREYLTGDVRAKHDHAMAAAGGDARYQRNVAALAAVTPRDLGPTDISVGLGAPWVAPGDIEDFVHEVMGGRVKVWHLPSAAMWKIVPTGRVPAAAHSTYGTSRMNGYALVTAGLNGRLPIVWDTEREMGRTRRVRNGEQSLAAQEKLAAIQARFATWVWEDAGRCARLCAEYNRRFNSHIERPHDGSQLTFPGLADGIELWPWQRDIVARIISSPATLCGHAVGAGKTLSMVCTAMTARRLGLARKPLITVPTHLVEQAAREARQAYPFGNFLIAGEHPATGRQAELLAARCASGDWDAVIMSHRMFASLPVEPETELAWLQERRDAVDADLRAGRGGRFGRTELRRRLAAIGKQLERLADPALARPSVPFEALGADLLLVDEAHYFKRLPITSRHEGISFGSSQRAVDLLLKVRTLRGRRPALPTVALFTGTPWSNTIAETFVWQRFLQPDVLADAGVEHFDAWAAVFVDYETTVEVTPDASGFRTAARPSRIRNLPELRSMFDRCADVLGAEVLDLERPARAERTVVCVPTPRQLDYVRSLAARADKIRREPLKPRPGDDNMLVLCTDGRRAALDPNLVGIAEPASKVSAIADHVARIHREVPGVLQLVFCDQGTPGRYGLQTYSRLRIELDARGVPPDRVRWVHEANSASARAALFAACRSGEVSVLIGSTDKLGVGTNVQTRLRAVHHADAPWRPSDIEQREGRAFRPGNLNPVVEVVRYVTEGTFDAYMWQTLQRKARFIEQLLHRDSEHRHVDDLGDTVLTFAEVKALATGNPVLLEQAQAAADVRRLQVLRSVDLQSVTAARATITEAERAQADAMRLAAMLRAARDRLAGHGALDGDGSAADAVRAAAVELYARLVRAGLDRDPGPIRAPWRGLGAELLPVGGWATDRPDAVSLRVTVGHRRVDEIVLARARIARNAESCARAVVRSLERWATALDARITEVAAAAAAAYDVAQDAQQVVDGYRFERADELARAEARLGEIDTALESSVQERWRRKR
ncbi:MAG: helicase-related protein [Jatrophihabitans sp.]